jgi:hypothetical protein
VRIDGGERPRGAITALQLRRAAPEAEPLSHAACESAPARSHRRLFRTVRTCAAEGQRARNPAWRPAAASADRISGGTELFSGAGDDVEVAPRT